MHVTIDHKSVTPPGEQLRRQLVLLIVGGTLRQDDRLPSVRQLAADLGLAPGTVAKVYRSLEESGHVVTSGAGTRVAALGRRAARERSHQVADAAREFAEVVQRADGSLQEALEAVRQAFTAPGTSRAVP